MTEVERLVEEMAVAVLNAVHENRCPTKDALRIVLKAIEQGEIVDAPCSVEDISLKPSFKEFMEDKS